MEGFLISMMVLGSVVGALIGGIILMLLAKYIGKIPQATFGNSFIVCLVASAVYSGIWYVIGLQNVIAMGFLKIMLFNLLILSVPYILVGKLIWKSSWIAAVKANGLWILSYALLMGYIMTASNM